MQLAAVEKIAEMNEDIRPGVTAKIITWLGWLLLAAVAISQLRTLWQIRSTCAPDLIIMGPRVWAPENKVEDLGM